MNFKQVDITGSRLVGALTDLKHIGPKHHGIVLGLNIFDQNVYVAESRYSGYQIATVDDFVQRYSPNAEVRIHPNDGDFSDIEVAQRALNEINQGGNRQYNLTTNNCESFSNRAMYDDSTSKQIIHTAIGLIILVGAVWYIKNNPAR